MGLREHSGSSRATQPAPRGLQRRLHSSSSPQDEGERGSLSRGSLVGFLSAEVERATEGEMGQR